MNALVPPSYGEKIDRLLAPLRLNELGPGKPNVAARDELQALCSGSGFAPGVFASHRKVVDGPMGTACIAGLWLYHDFLDESHSISQELESREGSYWHGIMHRREPDYANAKYWFRRVGDHPIAESLAAAARELAGAAGPDAAAAFLLDQPRWDSFRFVDLCQAAAAARSTSAMLCRQIQQREWWLLFDYCYQRACSPEPLR